jgi:MFS family permease
VRFLPTDKPEPAGRLDVTGLVLLALGLPAAIYGLAEIQSGHTARWVTSLVVGLLLIAAFAWHARRVPEPLLDTRLYQKPTFVAASVATFCLGAAIFGGMILLPLYFQNVRGTDPVVTGLLLIPQGIGVALAMGFTGRLVDRVGGGIVALGGVVITSVFTLPLVLIGAHTSYVLISFTLVARGVGVGSSMMPSMAAAFAVLRPDEIHDASPQLNVIQRVGGSVGTALLAVILSHNIAEATASRGRPPGPSALARAFGDTFWWALGITVVAAIPAAFLMVSERQTRRRDGPGQRFVSDEDGLPIPLFGLGEG